MGSGSSKKLHNEPPYEPPCKVCTGCGACPGKVESGTEEANKNKKAK